MTSQIPEKRIVWQPEIIPLKQISDKYWYLALINQFNFDKFNPVRFTVDVTFWKISCKIPFPRTVVVSQEVGTAVDAFDINAIV